MKDCVYPWVQTGYYFNGERGAYYAAKNGIVISTNNEKVLKIGDKLPNYDGDKNE